MNVEQINQKLIDDYGLDIGLGIPKFRIVWSTNQFEKRYGEYNIFSESGAVFLRTERGVEEVPKYLPQYPDMWVLERLQSTEGNPYLEMVAKFSYEPLWVFGSGNSDRIPIWRAVQLLIRNVMFGDPNAKYKSLQTLFEEEEAKKVKEKEIFKTILQNESPHIASSLHAGEAVTVPSNYERSK